MRCIRGITCETVQNLSLVKYPAHTISKPVVGSAARRVVVAVKEGKMITNVHAKATAARIAKRHAQSKK